MPREFTIEIEEDQCIGDSLVTLNNNFSALDVAVQNSTQATSTTISELSTLAKHCQNCRGIAQCIFLAAYSGKGLSQSVSEGF